MTTVEATQDITTDATDPRTTHRTGHIGRITALTMAAGAAAALLLAFVVLRGVTEPVVTGAVLVAFGASWALLAMLARRRTDQPQPWARVPAVVMAGLGIVCLALRPSDAAMSAAGWVWPLGLVALAAWMVVQSRRSLRSWSRRAVLYPIFGLMIIGGIGAAYETVREAQDRATYAAPGELVDVGGRRLHIDCTGTGSPTVVLEAGLGEPSTIMAGWIAPAVAPTTRVCVYDRAGKGWSDPAPDGADRLAVATDLHTLLERHGETGPFVLAGHSSGGVYVQAYAATYPDEVAGVVLIDGQPRTALTDLPGYAGDYEALRAVGGVAPSAARFGVMRLVSEMSSAALPDPVRAQERAFGSTSRQARSMRDEIAALPAVMRRAAALTTLGDRPLVVVTAEQDAMEGWLPLQADSTRLSSNSAQRSVPDATHISLVEDEHDAANASRAILDVVQSVRTHSALDAPAGPGEGSMPVARPTTAVDELVTVDGARMHLRCSGSGAATVVLIAGFEGTADIWNAVSPALEQQARVCAHDKFGTGSSDPSPTTPQSFATQASDLRSALTSAGEPGPYVVVGHSFGGAEAVAFAADDPEDVMGLVLVDASPTDWATVVCDVRDDGTAASQSYRQLCTTISTPALNAERLDARAAFAEVAEIDTLHDLPIAVLTAPEHGDGLSPAARDRVNGEWRVGQQHWVSLSSAARLVTVDGTGHVIQVDQPAAVVEQVRQLLR